MFIAVMMGIALAAGYTTTIVISMILTFAVAMALPRFVEGDHLIRNGYKIVHELFWLLGATIGGYVTATVVKSAHPQVTQVLLVAALIWVLWANSWEARQRGIAHQVLITVFTVLGVAGGYVVVNRGF